MILRLDTEVWAAGLVAALWTVHLAVAFGRRSRVDDFAERHSLQAGRPKRGVLPIGSLRRVAHAGGRIFGQVDALRGSIGRGGEW